MEFDKLGSGKFPKGDYMKRQTGFTLIELLLVLAIIGIISAIAIPALLGQRSRARDKSAQENCVSVLADIISSADKAKEAGVAVDTAAALDGICRNGYAQNNNVPTIPQLVDAKNPWGTAGAALAYTPNQFQQLAASDAGTIRAMVNAGLLGQVGIGFFPPDPATGASGVIGTSVYMQNPFDDTASGGNAQEHIFYKAANME
jgi:prepilin-type N-terminal cleavage/methylation domain-containing protein